MVESGPIAQVSSHDRFQSFAVIRAGPLQIVILQTNTAVGIKSSYRCQGCSNAVSSKLVSYEPPKKDYQILVSVHLQSVTFELSIGTK